MENLKSNDKINFRDQFLVLKNSNMETDYRVM